MSFGMAIALCLTSVPFGLMGTEVSVKAASVEDEDWEDYEEDEDWEDYEEEEDWGDSEQSEDSEEGGTQDIVGDWDENVRVISTAQDLINLSKENESFEGETIVLDADIKLSKVNDFSGICMSSSESFKGTFDGCGHSISGINISGQKKAGLFGYIGKGGIVQNVTIKDADISLKGQEFRGGGIAAEISNGTIQNCHVVNTKIIQTPSYSYGSSPSALLVCVGGIVGYAKNTSIIRNCSFDGEIKGSLSGGGLVGFVDYDGTYQVMIVNSVNHGSVKGGRSGSGGILGRNTNGRVINCYNTGMVSTTNDSEKVGALVGYNSSNGVIDCCYALQGTSEKMVGYGDFEDCFFLSQEEMISSDFADQLNANVGDDEQYMPWIFAEGEYPFLKEVVNLQNCNISLTEGQVVYNGKSQKPGLTIQDMRNDSGDLLKYNEDYTTVYFNNTEAGTASVRVKGIGDYTGSRAFRFEIAPFDMKNAMVTLDKSQYFYNGSEQTPSVSIQGMSLVKDRDYTVEYQNNLEVGEGSIVLSGIGSCTGTITKTFAIEKGNLSNCQITLSQSEYIYSENEIKPEIQVLNEKNYALVDGKDYTVSYVNNTMPGEGKVIVTGQGNYTGEVEKVFQILVPPTPEPTTEPTQKPTVAPTQKPTTVPSQKPTLQPTPQLTSPSTQNVNQGGIVASQTPASSELVNAKAVGVVKGLKVTMKKRQAKVSWKKVSGAQGYQICYSTSKKFKNKKQLLTKNNKVTLKKMKSGKTYFVKVRVYTLDEKKKVYGKWSKVMKLR